MVGLLFKMTLLLVGLILQMALILVYLYFVLDETDTGRFVQVRSVKRNHFIFIINVLVLKERKVFT